MPTNFPTGIDTFAAKKVIDLEDALEAVEAKLGVDGSAVVSTVDKKLATLTTDVAATVAALAGKQATITPGTYVGTAGPRPAVVADSRVFAVDPTGATNSTAGLVAAFAAASKRLIIPDGTYLVNPGSLVIPAGVVVEMYGAKLQATAAGALLGLNTDSEVHGGELQGFGSSATYNDNDRLVTAIGTLATYKKHMLLRDMYLHGAGGYGVRADFIEDFEVDNCRFFDIAYAAYLVQQAKDTWIRNSEIDMNNPIGSGPADAYGVSFGRSQGTLADFPRSVDCGASSVTVRNVQTWEGFDTHGGERIKFLDVTALNCKWGVSIVSSANESSVSTFAPLSCVVDGYTIDSQVTDGSRQAGIVVQGTASEKARACVVGSGSVIGHGAQATSISGGIEATRTLGLKIDGAVVIDCSPASVALRGDNRAFSAQFTSVDPWTTTGLLAPHLYLSAGNNTGHLGDHVFERITKVAAYVSSEGVRVENTAGNALTLSPGYETTVGRAAGVDGTMTKYVDIGEKITTPIGRGLTIGELGASSTSIKNVIVSSQAWDPVSLAAGATTVSSWVVTGVRPGDPVIASHDQIGANSVMVSAHVRAVNLVWVILRNETGAVYDIPAGTVRVAVLNFT